MNNTMSEILKHYHVFGLLNIFLLYTLLLAYSDRRLTLWYGVFVFSVALDLFNYVGLFELYNYSPNFSLAYLPWSAFTPIALYGFTLKFYDIQDGLYKKTLRVSFFFFCILFSYFIIKSYWVLLGDIIIRNQYFFTEYSFPFVEYWSVKGIVFLFQIGGLLVSYSIIKSQSTKPSKDLYLLFLTQLVITIVATFGFCQDIIYEPVQIISAPNGLYLTIVISCGLFISYKKIIGIDTKNRTVKQSASKSYELDTERLKNIQAKIIASMEEQQLYKNRKLQLRDLSKAIRTSENHISEVLAKQLNTNYYDFINGYRVKEVISLMNSEEHKDYKLLILATESGFNSKTTFNTAFKKVTGQTPSAFRKENF